MVLFPAMVALTTSVGTGFDPLAGGLEQLVDRSQNQGAHFLGPALFAGINDARDHILAAADLLVVFGHLGPDLPADQVHQPEGDRGGADIDRRPPERLIRCGRRGRGRSGGPSSGSPGSSVRARSMTAVTCHSPSRRIVPNCWSGAQGGLQRGNARLVAQGRLQAAPIVGLVIQAGRRQAEEHAPDGLRAGRHHSLPGR